MTSGFRRIFEFLFRLLFRLRVCAGLLLLAPCGCTSLSEYLHNGFKVGPNYAPAPAPLAKDWIDSKDMLDAAAKRPRQESDDLTTWWTVFNDANLNELMDTAAKQNLTLRQAGYRILQARALRGIAVGEMFPQSQFAEASFQRNATSQEIAGASLSSRDRYFSQWNLGFGLAWELDFWGRFRRAVESADANLDASVDDYNDVLVTLLSDVATNYVQMRTLQKRIEYAHLNVDIQRRTRDYTKSRFGIDTNGKLAFYQAEALLNQTEASIPELEISLRQTTNRLCILLGMPPEDLLPKLNPPESVNVVLGIPGGLLIRIPTAPDTLTLGAPADLLRRRPDVRRAERQAAAQSALIGVAEADFYPHISLVGTLGWSADSFKSVFRPTAFNGTFGPTAQWNILNYGRILNNVRLEDAKLRELLAAYQNKVLTAQQEVEDGWVAYVKAQQRTRLQYESVDAAMKASALGDTLLPVGIAPAGGAAQGVNFTTVTLIQQNLVQQQDTLAQAEGEIALGLIQVYRALGGGWQPGNGRCAPTAVHVPVAAAVGAPSGPPVASFGRPF